MNGKPCLLSRRRVVLTLTVLFGLGHRLVCGLVLASGMVGHDKQWRRWPREGGEQNTKHPRGGATLRKIVYTEGLVTSHQVSTAGVAYTELVVPSEFEQLYKAKRLSALRLLLDVVKEGRPQEALSAAAFATAMEEDPAEGGHARISLSTNRRHRRRFSWLGQHATQSFSHLARKDN